MKTNTLKNKGFTLIELIMVTIILGILAAVAIPRYVATVSKAEAAAEDAVISSIKSGLETYATEQFMANGRRSWPTDPFTALNTSPSGHNTLSIVDAVADAEWTFNTTTSAITHMRGDNTLHHWDYSQGTTTSGQESVGTFAGGRDAGNSGPVYVNHDWCASYCYDIANGMQMPNGGWPFPEYPVEECDCS